MIVAFSVYDMIRHSIVVLNKLTYTHYKLANLFAGVRKIFQRFIFFYINVLDKQGLIKDSVYFWYNLMPIIKYVIRGRLPVIFNFT